MFITSWSPNVEVAHSENLLSKQTDRMMALLNTYRSWFTDSQGIILQTCIFIFKDYYSIRYKI